MDATNRSPVSSVEHSSVTRRSGNYPPNLWDFDFLQSLGDAATVEEGQVKAAEKLTGQVRSLILQPMEPLPKLELLDAVRRLGIQYHFQTEFKSAVVRISLEQNHSWWTRSLHATALRFRLLRENGIFVPQDVFPIFNKGPSHVSQPHLWDVKGLLSTYEASFLGWEGEDILDDAQKFAFNQLRSIHDQISSPTLAKLVHRALDLPFHWRAIRYEARWYIDLYKEDEDMNPCLIKFAMLDFNIVQSLHQKEISTLIRWWAAAGMDKLTFARNGIIQSYMYAIGMLFEPHFREIREMEAKIGAIQTTIDDIYDAYGTMEELQQFTNIVQSWDPAKADPLSHNLKMPLLTLFHTSNGFGNWILKENGFDGTPYIAGLWTNLINSYIKEARWLHEGYKPTLAEYMENALVSIGFPNLLITSYLLTVDHPTKENLEYGYNVPLIVRASSILCRLINDLGTSQAEMERGDTIKSIHCYMNETGASLEAAYEHIKGLVLLWWKRLNKCFFDPSPFTEPFLSFTINVVRASHFFYQYGDGYGNAESWTKEHGMSSLVHPLPLIE